jgi:hypothetical protein
MIFRLLYLSSSCWVQIHGRSGDLRLLAAARGCSGGDLVFVREPAEDLFSADLVLGEVDLRRPRARLSRCELAKGAMRRAVL